MKIPLLLLILTISSTLFAQIKLVDPGIPDSERIVYSVVDDGSSRKSFYEQRTIRKMDSANQYYEISIHSSESDLTAKVRPADFFVYNTESINSFNNSSVCRTSSIVKNNARLAKNEIGLLDYASLVIALRGFPFSTCTEASLIMLGMENTMAMKVSIIGRETILAGGTNIDCCKLELGVSGFWGKLLPKSRFWYAISAPHQLVRFEGSKAGPGSPLRTLQLTDYVVKQQ